MDRNPATIVPKTSLSDIKCHKLSGCRLGPKCRKAKSEQQFGGGGSIAPLVAETGNCIVSKMSGIITSGMTRYFINILNNTKQLNGGR